VLSDAQRAAVTDPVVRNLLPLIPTANATSATGAPRFIGTGSANVNIDQWVQAFGLSCATPTIIADAGAP